MNPEEIFLEAIDKPTAAERSRFLDRACEGDVSLRRQVEGLLTSHEVAGGFLEETLLVTRQTADPAELQLGPGSVVGAYKLLQEIGEGGFGVVYMAEQTLPVRRLVALKIIRPGMDSREVIARFESERQALALMEHPNIARVLDAGATVTGHPYFVMELVRGVPITDYADANKLSPRERLELFLAVCGAVQHAHQKGIIHRDLKPSNILVTLHDGVPVPKVIDFGIAKATSSRLTEKTLFTRHGQFVGTPAYVSPEQAEMSGLDVDTRSDIYSLGILLYELLTGTTPLSAADLRAAGFMEMQRRIREVEAQRPSTRVSTLKAETRTAVATKRNVQPEELARALRGDMDWIILRALEKDRTRRYETAMDLARDIGRHIRNEPVEAGPSTRIYRARKFLQRNKLLCGSTLAVLTTILGSLGFSLWMYGRERRAHVAALDAQQTAVDEAATKDVVTTFLLEDVLGQADSLQQAESGVRPQADLTVREAVDRAAARIGNRFAGRPLLEAAVRATLGNAIAGLGSHRDALPQLEQSLKLLERERGAGHEATIGVRIDLAVAYRETGRLEDAIALHQAIRRNDEPRFPPSHPLMLRNLYNCAGALRDAGRTDQAIVVLEEALGRAAASHGVEDRELLFLRTGLISLYERVGRLNEALSMAEPMLLQLEAGPGKDHPYTLDLRTILGWVYQRLGRVNEAITFQTETVARLERVRGPEHPGTLGCKGNLADAYRRAGRFEEAQTINRQVLEVHRRILGPDHQATLSTLNNLALTHLDAGQPREAVPLLEEVRERLQGTVAPDHPYLLLTLDSLCRAYHGSGRWELSVRVGELALTGSRQKLGVDREETASTASHLAAAYLSVGRYDAAAAGFREALAWQEKNLGTEHVETIATRAALAAALGGTGQLEEAISLGESAYRQLLLQPGPAHPRTLWACTLLAESHLRAARPESAEALWREQAAVTRKNVVAGSLQETSLSVGLGRCLLAQGKHEELETLLRPVVASCLTALEGHVVCFQAQSLLGAALFARGKLEEAEPLLTDGYRGLRDRIEIIPPESRGRVREALERLAKLHEARGRVEEARRLRAET